MVTGCLQIRNGTYYALLYIKEDGKRKQKWISTGLPVKGTGKRKAEQAFEKIRSEYEEKRLQEKVTLEKEQLAGGSTEEQILLIDYLHKWLEQSRPTIAKTTL